MKDETTIAVMQETVKNMKKLICQYHKINKDNIKEIKTLLIHMREDIERSYVSKTEFNPIKNIVYGAVGLILTSVFLAIISLVVMRSTWT